MGPQEFQGIHPKHAQSSAALAVLGGMRRKHIFIPRNKREKSPRAGPEAGQRQSSESSSGLIS